MCNIGVSFRGRISSMSSSGLAARRRLSSLARAAQSSCGRPGRHYLGMQNSAGGLQQIETRGVFLPGAGLSGVAENNGSIIALKLSRPGQPRG